MKICAKVISPISTPVNSLSSVSLTPVINIYLRISPKNFQTIFNGILRGLGETDSGKKLAAKNLVSGSL
jgi:hypothetical protein